MRFKATHAIVIERDTVDVIPVQLVDDVCYTKGEWDSGSQPNWEISEGILLFQGRAVDGTSVVKVQVSK